MSAPNTVTFSGKLLEKMKREGTLTKEQLDFLRCEADKYLNDPTVYSVVYRNTKPPTNNPHEYASMGPYWWPNPDTEDGLPYVRRDGVVNPACAENMAYYVMAIAAFTLSLAAYYFAVENEIKTVRIVLSCKKNDMSVETIRERVRKLYV